MANKIKLAGTTSNNFQIGLQGVTIFSNRASSPYNLSLPANSGSASQVLISDGTGNLEWSNSAINAGTVTASSQPNITSVGTLVSANSNSTVSIYYTSATKFSTGFNVNTRGTTGDNTAAVTSGTELGFNGFYGWDGTTYGRGAYVLAKTTEDWTSSNRGANFSIATTANGVSAPSVKFTIEENGNVRANGNMSVTGNITGANILLSGNVFDTGSGLFLNTTTTSNVVLAPNQTAVVIATTTGANITGTLSVSGNANVGNIGATNGVFTNISGNGASLTGITGSNITGTVANATYATTAGTVTTNAQPNITSVGTLSSLSVSGNLTVGNLSVTNYALAALKIGNTSACVEIGNGTITSFRQGIFGNSVGAPYYNLKLNDSSGDGSAIWLSAIDTNSITTGKYISGDGVYYNENQWQTTGGKTVATAIGFNSGNLRFFTDSGLVASANYTPSQRMIISNSGNVGIGNTDPKNTLSITGTLNVSGNANVGNIGATNGVFTNVSGNGAALTSIPGANITGTVTSATSATTAGTVTTNAQPNITSVGTLTSLSVTGNIQGGNFLTDGNILVGTTTPTANIHVSGNVNSSVRLRVENLNNGSGAFSQYTVTAPAAALNGYAFSNGYTNAGRFVQTSGLVDATGQGGLGLAASGATANMRFYTNSNNLRMIIDSAGNVGIGNTAPTHTLSITGTLNVSGNANVGNLGATGIFATTLSATGNANVGNIGATNGVFTNISGNGAGLTSISGANITGTVANATYATSAGSAGSATTASTVTTAAQPNITSVGTLTSLSVSGNANVGNLGTAGSITATGNVQANYFSGNGSLLTGVVSTSTALLANGTSNVAIPASGGNINFTIGGSVNEVVFTSTGANVNGYLSVSGNANVGNLGTAGRVTATGLSASYGTITGNGVGAFTAIMGTTSSATWLLAGTSNGDFRGGIQLLDAGGVMRFYEGANFMAFGGNNLSVSGKITGGNLDVGTTAAIAGSSGLMAIGAGLLGTGTGGVMRIIGSSNTTYIQSGIYNTSNSSANLAFTTILNGREWMRLDDNGNLGVNIAAPTSKLHVSGTSNITGAAIFGSTVSAAGNTTGANLITNSYIFESVGAGLTATGTTQGTGLALTKSLNEVTTVASSANAVVLPTAVAGISVVIRNATANILNVFPAAGAAIDTLATNAGTTVTANTTAQYWAVSTTKWYSK